jgi:hypothetical protein
MRNLLILIPLAIWNSSCGPGKKHGADSPSPHLVETQGKASAPGRIPSPSDKKAFRLQWTWDVSPTAETYISATMGIQSPDGTPYEGIIRDVRLTPWMPSMGHGTYTDELTVTPIPDEAGKFRVEGLYFIMGGPWEIKISAMIGEVKDTARLEVNVE